MIGTPSDSDRSMTLWIFFGEGLAERAAEDREVLREHAHLAAVDRAEAGDHAVGVRAGVLEPHAVRLVAREHVELDEAPLVEQVLEPLARGELALARAGARRRARCRRGGPPRGGARGPSAAPPSSAPWRPQATEPAQRSLGAPRRARSGCRTRPTGARTRPSCPASRAAAPRR